MHLNFPHPTFDYDQSKFPLRNATDDTVREFRRGVGCGVELPAGPITKSTADIRSVCADNHITM